MRIIHRYIGLSYLSSLILCLLVLTFVMSIGLLYKAVDLIASGVDAKVIGQVFASGIPSVLSVALPVAVLGSALLVFGRFSADGEITALKACGLGLPVIMQTPILIAICLSMVSLYVNMQVTPAAHLMRRSLLREYSRTAPLELIEPGANMALDHQLRIRVGQRDGDQLSDILIIDTRGEHRIEVKAVRGTVSAVEVDDPYRDTVTKLRVFMEDVRIIDEAPDGERNEAKADSYTADLDIAHQRRAYTKKRADMSFGELWGHMHQSPEVLDPVDPEEGLEEKIRSYLEMHERVVMALACIGFVCLAVPLGVKAQRRESWVGAVMSLGILIGFYLLLIIAQNFAKQGFIYAHLLLWVPMLLMSIIGIVLIRRSG